MGRCGKWTAKRPCFLTALDVHKDEFEKVFPDLKVKAFLKKPITIDNLVTNLEALPPR